MKKEPSILEEFHLLFTRIRTAFRRDRVYVPNINNLLKEREIFFKVRENVQSLLDRAFVKDELSKNSLVFLLEVVKEELFDKAGDRTELDYNWVTRNLQIDKLVAHTSYAYEQLFKYNEKLRIIHPPKLYILCGPSGVGKTTIIRHLAEDLGVKRIKKYTTRNYRSIDEQLSGMVTTIPVEEFISANAERKLMAVHRYYSNMYGIHFDDIVRIYQSQETFLFDTCDIKTALNLRELNPGIVKIILLLTDPELIEKGLLNRMHTLSITDIEEAIKNNQLRVSHMPEEYAMLRAYREDTDFFVEGDYNSNKMAVEKIIKGN